MDPAYSGITRKGFVYDNSGVLVKNSKLHVYHKDKLVAFGKTSIEGRVKLKFIPEWTDHKMALTFRLCNEVNHAKNIPGVSAHLAKHLKF